MQTRTHENLAKIFLPYSDPKVIKRVNYVLDNPSQRHKVFNKSYAHRLPNGTYINPMDFLDLSKHSSHRRYNHDFTSALSAGYMVGGVQGARAAMVHLFADKLSDTLRFRHGARKRDLIEAYFNYVRS